VPENIKYEYTFENISKTIEKNLSGNQLKKKPNVYALGYGGPVTFTIIIRNTPIPDMFCFQIPA